MTLAIAHRGDPVTEVENTMPAFEAALAAGADMVELDVRLSRDGVPIVIHDADLARIWNRPVPLNSLDAAALADLRGPGDVGIPTLEGAARRVVGADVQLMVDLPAEDAGVAAFELLTRLGLVERCVFAGETAALRRHSETARIALTWDNPQPPDDETFNFYRPEFFNPYFQLLTATIADDIHERGMAISVWTVDHPRDMASVITQGADAVITNRIADLVRLVER